jgi:hypothetical protein
VRQRGERAEVQRFVRLCIAVAAASLSSVQSSAARVGLTFLRSENNASVHFTSHQEVMSTSGFSKRWAGTDVLCDVPWCWPGVRH